MEELHLSETELRYFSDLFVCCDNENTGKVLFSKAIELFRSGNVPAETLNQITEMCCNKQNYLTKKQFFSILKLIAAHQASVPVKPELLNSNVELPLPRFTWPSSENWDLIELSNHTDSEVEVNGSGSVRCGSPGASSTASDSPTPTNSVQERSWAITGAWQGIVCEEQRQLLGTEEESSDKHSSEEDTEITNEVYTITSEQREYYTAQFRSLQPDPNALLAGSIARLFFEKSRLPISELKKIWQLSDITKDGALSLQEFNTAMHLVVLRRNHIPLPATLPVQLIPNTKEWTKFSESPLSSPGPKPVNFDFQKSALEKDPKILHPVPVRVTPEITPQDDAADGPPKSLQRPTPLKTVNHRGIIPPPPPNDPLASKKEPPPPPPPRPFKTHGRSSSLDLNRLAKSLAAPPNVPPRTTPPKLASAEPDDSERYENVFSEPPRKHGAFEVYRKPVKWNESCPLAGEDLEKYERYLDLKEQNVALVRLCQELSQELADVKHERTRLKVRWEQVSKAQGD